ncbi:MAG TPA: TonB-dependent receptor [Kofleriaceae bacterium]|jgi:outer membrane receptor protein involved in Fe transport
MRKSLLLVCALASVANAQPTDPPPEETPPEETPPPVSDAPAPAPEPTGPTIEELQQQAEAEAQKAATDANKNGETIEIEDTAPAESASSVHLTAKDLGYRSRTQVSDILRQVPGLMVSQHAGGGKSDQYFIRGFDADHGTDIAIYADGIPVNMPSHGHGQGYADTHFLIPELVDVVDVHKGPYSARFGDFYTAGAMELKTIDAVDAPTIVIAGGSPLAGPKAFEHYNRRVVGMASPELRADHPDDKALIAVQIANSDGPFVNPQNFRQGNALVKWKGAVGPGDLHIETSWYSGRWNASGQLPDSEVKNGTIGRFDSLDPSEGGDTSRTTGQIGYTVRDDHGGTWRAMAYVLEYRLRLFSNFTLFARDTEHGDEIEQGDSRTTWGLDTAYDKHFDLAGLDTFLTVGAQVRNDTVDNGLWHVQKRVRLPDCFDEGTNPCNHTNDRIREMAGYVEANIHVLPNVHLLPGLRYEQFVWDVDDLDPETQNDPTKTTGGTAGAGMFLPKLSVEIEATQKLNVFINSGEGFHSNDARSNVASHGDGALARAIGAEAGVRTTYIPHARFSADFWYLHLASELVWSGDAGSTEASGKTRRYGVDLEGSYNPLPWLRLDGTVSLARSTLVANAGNSGALALAPKIMGQGGVTLVGDKHFISVRTRGIGDRPGNDDGTLTAQGYIIFDIMAGQTIGPVDLDLTVNNVLNTKWREAQFADVSRVTPTADLVEQMHYTPGIPLTATIAAAYKF